MDLYSSDEDEFDLWVRAQRYDTTTAVGEKERESKVNFSEQRISSSEVRTLSAVSPRKAAMKSDGGAGAGAGAGGEGGGKNALDSKAEYELKFAMEQWYDQLKDCTFETFNVPLNPEETRMLFRSTMHDTGTNKELGSLVNKISEAMQRCGSGGVFVKLHTRSPKDALASISNQALVSVIERKMKPASKKNPERLKMSEKVALANDDANLLSNCVREISCFQSPKEVMNILRQSSRVASDLNKAVDAHRGTVLVLRAYQRCFAEDEFRCFVHSKKLTGISQYCYSQFFPEILKRRALIQSAIQQFFDNSFLPRSPYPNCIVDIVLQWNDKKHPTVKLIEINPWFQDTGALLFSWKSEQDRAILRDGFEFRILEAPIADPYECLPFEWREWFMQRRGFRIGK